MPHALQVLAVDALAFLLPPGYLPLQIVNKVLSAFLRQQFARLIGHLRRVAQPLYFIALRASHHRFCFSHSTSAFSRIWSMNFELLLTTVYR